VADRKPPVVETAVTAWGGAFRAIEAMPVVAAIAFVLVIVTSLASHAVIPSSRALVGSPWSYVIAIGSGIVNAALLAPLAIAVHRFVLLGEITNRYPLEPGSSRYLRFVGFAIVVQILPAIPFYIIIPDVRNGPVFAAGLSIVGFVLLIAIMTIVLRRAILFPALAIDAPGATWRKASLDTKGSSWRVTFIFVLTALPVVLLSVIFVLAMPRGELNSRAGLFSAVLDAVVNVPMLCAFAAAASRIYEARADLMTRPGS
jgi:hypothetical protein